MKLAVLVLSLFSLSAFASEQDPAYCKQLREKLKSIETHQRQPLTGQQQDQLKAEKRQVQDTMQKLSCNSF